MKEPLLLHSMDLCCKYMQSHSGRNIGLVSGETALLLCFYYFYKKSNHYKYKRLMLRLAEEQLEGINNNFDFSLDKARLLDKRSNGRNRFTN